MILNPDTRRSRPDDPYHGDTRHRLRPRRGAYANTASASAEDAGYRTEEKTGEGETNRAQSCRRSSVEESHGEGARGENGERTALRSLYNDVNKLTVRM